MYTHRHTHTHTDMYIHIHIHTHTHTQSTHVYPPLHTHSSPPPTHTYCAVSVERLLPVRRATDWSRDQLGVVRFNISDAVRSCFVITLRHLAGSVWSASQSIRRIADDSRCRHCLFVPTCLSFKMSLSFLFDKLLVDFYQDLSLVKCFCPGERTHWSPVYASVYKCVMYISTGTLGSPCTCELRLSIRL